MAKILVSIIAAPFVAVALHAVLADGAASAVSRPNSAARHAPSAAATPTVTSAPTVPRVVAMATPVPRDESLEVEVMPLTELAAEVEQRAPVDAALAQQSQTARREAAWEAFYRPRSICLNPPSVDVQTECGNEYMRAQRAFEEKWEREALR